MPNNADWGEGKKGQGGTGGSDESDGEELPRYAGRKHTFEEDTDSIVLPKPTPEVTEDDDDKKDEKKADSAFDDLEIYVDEDELQAESESQSPGRKY